MLRRRPRSVYTVMMTKYTFQYIFRIRNEATSTSDTTRDPGEDETRWAWPVRQAPPLGGIPPRHRWPGRDIGGRPGRSAAIWEVDPEH